MVAARRLRKSVLNDFGEVDMNLYNIKRSNLDINYNKEINLNNNKSSFKNNILFKCFISSLILFSCLIVKLFFFNDILSNNILNRVYNHYKYDFSKEQTLNNLEEVCKKNYGIIENMIPINIIENVKNKYLFNLKPLILELNVLNSISNILYNDKELVYNEIKTYNKKLNSKKLYIDTKKLNESSKFVKKDDQKEIDLNKLTDVEFLNSKKIELVKPTNGVVTSPFGQRAVIFEGVNPYHTGIDIANKLGTDIVSVCDGIVINIISNNKYYGNYIEILRDGIIFKYAHLDKIIVSKNDKVTKGKLIGYMGSTGFSTGPHLHFEIEVRGNKINPDLVMDF